LNQLKTTIESLTNKNEQYDDDDDWLAEQAKLAEKQRKVYELNLMVKSIENFNYNIEQIAKVLNITSIIKRISKCSSYIKV